MPISILVIRLGCPDNNQWHKQTFAVGMRWSNAAPPSFLIRTKKKQKKQQFLVNFWISSRHTLQLPPKKFWCPHWGVGPLTEGLKISLSNWWEMAMQGFCFTGYCRKMKNFVPTFHEPIKITILYSSNFISSLLSFRNAFVLKITVLILTARFQFTVGVTSLLEITAHYFGAFKTQNAGNFFFFWW